MIFVLLKQTFNTEYHSLAEISKQIIKANSLCLTHITHFILTKGDHYEYT